MRVMLIHLSWLFGSILGRLLADIPADEAERAGASAVERTIAAIRALTEGYDRCLVVPDAGDGWRRTVAAEHDERHNPWPEAVWRSYEDVATQCESQHGRDSVGLAMPVPYPVSTPPIPCGEAPITIAGLRPAGRDVIATIARWWAERAEDEMIGPYALTIASGRSSLAMLVDDQAGIDLVRDVTMVSGLWAWKRETAESAQEWTREIATSPRLVPHVAALASLPGIGAETARALVCGGTLRRAKLDGYGTAPAAVQAAVDGLAIPGLITGQLYTLRAAGARGSAGILRALAVVSLRADVPLDVGALLGRGEERGDHAGEDVRDHGTGRAGEAHARGDAGGPAAGDRGVGELHRDPARRGAGGAGDEPAPAPSVGGGEAPRAEGACAERLEGARVASQAAAGSSAPAAGAEPAPPGVATPAARPAPSPAASVTGEGAAEGVYRRVDRPREPTLAERRYEESAAAVTACGETIPTGTRHVCAAKAREETIMSTQPSTALARREPGSSTSMTHAADFGPEHMRIVREAFAPTASQAEFEVMWAGAKARGLDPVKKQIFFVKRWDSLRGEEVWSSQVSIDGFRSIAISSGAYDGQDEPEYEYDGEGRLTLARVRVWRRGVARAFVGVARWNEYVQTTKKGDPTHMWRKMEHTMLSKCAEALALRKAFPEALGGLYTSEEMEQASNEAEPVLRPEPKAAPVLPPAVLTAKDLLDRIPRAETSGQIIEIVKQAPSWPKVRAHAWMRLLALSADAAEVEQTRALYEADGLPPEIVAKLDAAAEARIEPTAPEHAA